ncbi:MAG: hypothetical protein HKL89_02405 [Candidatus Dormibacteraeota bacterium]|nr:hypothetical protein [Candidatus Dormibacteraeota bacterium]
MVSAAQTTGDSNWPVITQGHRSAAFVDRVSATVINCRTACPARGAQRRRVVSILNSQAARAGGHGSSLRRHRDGASPGGDTGRALVSGGP